MTAKVERFWVTRDALTRGIYEVSAQYYPPEGTVWGYLETTAGDIYHDGEFEPTAVKARDKALRMISNAIRQEQSVIANAQARIAKFSSLEF